MFPLYSKETALSTIKPRPRIISTSYIIIVKKKRLLFPRSTSPFLKKKLAPSRFYLLRLYNTVRDIDLPVAALLYSRKIRLLFGSSGLFNNFVE